MGQGFDVTLSSPETRNPKPEGYLALERLTNGLFEAKTTHIDNVGAFVADLLTSNDTWDEWKGRAPLLVDGAWA